MKIWFDVLTPKQLLFFEPMIVKLRKNHKILSTSRSYNEITNLAKIRKINLSIVGKHGGAGKYEKLNSSIDRMKKLSPLIKKFDPDIAISFCSPEASRIAFGLGIKHVAFSDSPQATAVMQLSIPLLDKLLIPWVIPKKEFEKFGINKKDIITYRAIDAASISKRAITKKVKLPFPKNKKNIIVRVHEEKAAYVKKKSMTYNIIKELISKFPNENISVICRYKSQKDEFQKKFGKKIIILGMSFDGKIILNSTDVFIGSGGTMTAESALLGVPTISYNAVPNPIEKYLIKKKLAKRITNPKQVPAIVKQFLKSKNSGNKNKVKNIVKSMEDPYQKLQLAIKSIN